WMSRDAISSDSPPAQPVAQRWPGWWGSGPTSRQHWRGRRSCASLAALEASEGRRRRRKRDTTPDAIGLGIKRALLVAAVAANPAPEMFEAWLLQCCLEAEGSEAGVGATRAMALEVLTEWRLATASPAFKAWLDRGAPSEDRQTA